MRSFHGTQREETYVSNRQKEGMWGKKTEMTKLGRGTGGGPTKLKAVEIQEIYHFKNGMIDNVKYWNANIKRGLKRCYWNWN